MKNETLLTTKEEEQEAMRLVESIMEDAQSNHENKKVTELPKHLQNTINGYEVEEINPFD